MRYIQKGPEPESLTNFKGLKHKNWKPSYDVLPDEVIKDIINSLLYYQGGLCCYCQVEINQQTSRLVHFHSQQYFKKEELNYENLFLSCSTSEGMPPQYQHCAAHKDEAIIPKFMDDTRCNAYFKYNTLGEVVPINAYGLRTIKQIQLNMNKLSPSEKTVLNTIEVLNLNASKLKEQRKAIITELAKVLRKVKDKEKIKHAMTVYQKRDKNGRYPRFAGVVLSYLSSL
ncbi:retron system putative HNH endonuclease [Microscilla marina]|uniref:TIGR02646 family protein n=1 Tax=Microscilla marina ATCC 23134 TaxID=313606 RepID=A1ZJH6_MICM2|nr:retron system putative HNH endonuclease [Microscilla marina]EAY29279.1 conserved hypothetical protein, putative [Microscilla marina ATCC 23134]